ncbi:MAG TPA: hypothetical protein VGA52_02310 [Anaerolineales bacterium]|jgi:hypothetical protein
MAAFGAEIFWVVLAVSGWQLARWLGSQLADRLGERAWILPEIGPWLYGLALPYLAVLLGSVSADAMGLYGRAGWLGWSLSAVLLAGLVFLAHRLRQQLTLELPPIRVDRALLDEPRWALYRAAGQLWLVNLPMGLAAGLGLGLIEWVIRHQLWRPEQRDRPDTCLTLARLAGSTIAFALTGNLLLTAAFQACLLTVFEPTEAVAAT